MLRSTLFPLFLSFPPITRLARARSVYPTSLQHSPTVCRISSSNFSTLIFSPPTSAYLHLPFCRKRCHYCDFPIIALGSFSSSSATSHHDDDPRISNYVDLLIREIEAAKVKSDDNPPLETVFLGGGTPSLVPPPLVAQVLDVLRSKFGMCDDAEVSIEMDPGTFDAGRLEEFIGLGVNRVSLGVQAFQEELLRDCGRAHGVKDVYEAIDMIAGCPGLENWSMDLISSLPHQKEKMWEESLQCAIDARPSHVSVYDLQVEQGTKFGQLYAPGEFPLPTEIQSANFYKMASEALSKAGYNHYEISSYCQNGYECKHNLTYWQNRSFYGFGLGSASYIDGVRFSRPRRLKEYADYVQKQEDGITSHKDTCLDAKDIAMDEERRALSGVDLQFHLDNDCEKGNEVAFIRLSDPDGFLLSNELISIAFGVLLILRRGDCDDLWRGWENFSQSCYEAGRSYTTKVGKKIKLFDGELESIPLAQRR